MDKETYLKVNKQKLALTHEMRTCFLGIPHVIKKFKPDDPINPDISTYHYPNYLKDQKEDDEYEYRHRKKKQEHVALYDSCFKPVRDKKAQKRSYLFENADLVADTSMGQRAFNRNIDRIGNQLIGFYRKNYDKQFKATVMEVEHQKDREPTEEEALRKAQFDALLLEIRERPAKELKERLGSAEIKRREQELQERIKKAMACDSYQRDYFLKSGDGRPREPTKADRMEKGFLNKFGLKS
jgi:hypothetical protein